MKDKTHKDIISGWHPFTHEEIDRYVSKGYWHNMVVCDLLDHNASIFPDKVALVDEKLKLTWKELREKTNRIAIHLKSLGIEYGDFFLLQLPNIAESLILYFSLNRIGAIPVMSLPRYRKTEIEHQIDLHKVKGIAVSAGEKFDYVGMIEEIKDNYPHLNIFLTVEGKAKDWIFVDDLLEQGIEKEYPENYLEEFKPDPNDICTQQLSGGTTGLPKSIPRTHNDYICQWDFNGMIQGFTDESVSLVVIPVLHNASLQALCGPTIFRGGTIVLTKSPRPKEHYELIEKYNVTFILLIPVQTSYWMETENIMKEYDLSSLKVLISGAQKIKPDIVRWCRERLHVGFCNVFGMAEGPIIGTRWNSPDEVQMHTVGTPIIHGPDVQVKLVDDNNVEVKIGQVGEMCSRGPITFKGYFRNDEENADSFDEEGFFHSGDLMKVRPDGSFVVEGRKKDMIIRGGENVYAEPIEDLLVKHPKVVNAAVVGMPDTKLGEKLCAFIQLLEGEEFNFEQIKKYMTEQGMAVFQWPERIESVSGWPLTAVNKINKNLLQAYITAQLVEEGAIDRKFGNEFLKSSNITVDEVLSGKVNIEFEGKPL